LRLRLYCKLASAQKSTCLNTFKQKRKQSETFDRNPDNWTMTHHHATGHQFLSGKHSKV
jgi:hypothetical protein